MVWVDHRYDDVTRSEPMMFVTPLLPYSIFRFFGKPRFLIFLIGSGLACGSPTICLSGLANNPLQRKARTLD
jgi:hypothetical protein